MDSLISGSRAGESSPDGWGRAAADRVGRDCAPRRRDRMVPRGMMSNRTMGGRRVTGAGDLARRVVHAAGRLAFWALVTFHVGLFAVHVVQGRLFEPETAGRWIVAVLLLAGFRRLSHLGLPLVFGQRAVVLWLLVILLHCHAGWANGSTSLDLAVPETLGALSQITGSLTGTGRAAGRSACRTAAAAARWSRGVCLAGDSRRPRLAGLRFPVRPSSSSPRIASTLRVVVSCGARPSPACAHSFGGVL